MRSGLQLSPGPAARLGQRQAAGQKGNRYVNTLKNNTITHSFTFRLFLTVAAIIFAAVALSSALLYNYMGRTLREQVIRDERQALSSITGHISNIQESAAVIAQSIAISGEVQDRIREKSESHFRDLVKKEDMRTLLGSYGMLQNYFGDILIITEEGTVYSSNDTEEGAGGASLDWFFRWKDQNSNSGFSGIHKDWNEQGQGSMRAISYILKFRDLKALDRVMGYVIININLDSIEYILDGENPFTTYALYDGDRELILGASLPAGSDAVWQPDQDIRTLENRNVLLKDPDMLDGWTLAAEISNSYLVERMMPVVRILFLMILLLILIVLLGFSITVIHFTRPIRQLKTGAEKVAAGNLDIHLDIHTGDEFEILGDTFNKMVVSIRELLEKSVAIEKVNREMQISQLMLQINPHFIYNTLNSIVYLAYQHRDDDIVNYTNSFIALLQDTLKVDADNVFTSLDQEIRMIRNYIFLQDMRYPGRIHAEYQIDEDVLCCCVPHVFLQPIVENAIYHGLAVKPEGGHLWISASRVSGCTEIRIRDDGVGMDAQKLQEVLNTESSPRSAMRKIGIANVRNRIRQIYPDGKGELLIHSSPGEGSEVIIRIPFQEAEQA